jgi:hypothetical protein
MRILFDHSTPAPLRDALTTHVVVEAVERGWETLDNGALLDCTLAARNRPENRDRSFCSVCRLCSAAKNTLFDDLVGKCEDGWRNR